MLGERLAELNVELDNAVHRNCDSHRLQDDNPDVGEDGAVGTLAIALKILCNNSRDSHSNTDKAIMVDAYPNDIEPRQTAFRRSPDSFLPTATLGKPVYRHNPWLHRLHITKVLLLFMKIWRHIMAHKSEEGRDGKGFIAVADDLEIDGMPVIPYA